ncbi:MAG TPA: PIG-L family deacetylase [Thermoanaerobaculia bacterium]
MLWVGAHSDDETLMAGALIAELSHNQRRVFVISMTRGEGTGIRGSEADESVAAGRAREFCLDCSLYGAMDCISEHFPSRAHSDGRGGFEESPEEIIRTWRQLGPVDPVQHLEEWIRRVRPAWILTLDPDHGMYGHPEHRAVAQLVVAAARSIAGEIPTRVFAAENRFASLVPTNLDPGPVTLRIAGEVPCSAFRSCLDICSEGAATYASQGLPNLGAVPPDERFTQLRQIWPEPR